MATVCLKSEPGPGEVLLFRAEVPPIAASMITRLSAKLDSHEQERAERFVFEQDRAVFVSAHALLRYALGSIFEAGEICFRTNACGKPELDLGFEHGIHFNLSHTRGMAVCAICSGHSIGVDVEALDRSVDIEMLAERYFAANEHEMIMQAPSQDRAQLFFRLWTLKEAMLKAVGVGLLAPLREFSFTLDPVTSKMQLSRLEADSEWQICELSPTAVHCLALAVRRSTRHPVKVINQLIPLENLT